MGEEAADSKPASTNDQDGVAAEGTKTPLEMEMEKAKDMKVGELKMKLMAMGILTNSFCEKSEFVRAYAEAILERTAVTVEDGDDEDTQAAREQPDEEPAHRGAPLGRGDHGREDAHHDAQAQLGAAEADAAQEELGTHSRLHAGSFDPPRGGAAA